MDELGLEVGRVGGGGEGRLHGDLVGLQQVEQVLVEGLHPISARPREMNSVISVGARGVLDALLDGPRGAQDLDRGHPAVLLLVDQQPQRDDGLEVVRQARPHVELLLGRGRTRRAG